jgi:mRNA-degrading endonuclease toxin of MazEF toxin-antitoxin module
MAAYALAASIDTARAAVARARGRPLTRFAPMKHTPTGYRDTLLRAGFRNPQNRWPYPRVAAGPDPALLRPPLLLASFHVGSPIGLGALFEGLPGEVVVLFNARGNARPGMTLIDVSPGQQARAAGVARAIKALRAGGWAVTVVDGKSDATLPTVMFGRHVGLPRGAFAIARLANTPILPLAARWHGARIVIDAGSAIEPAAEETMAQAVATWLERYLTAHPEQTLAPVATLLRQAPLVEQLRERGVPDLPIVGPRDRPRGENADASRRETDRSGDPA